MLTKVDIKPNKYYFDPFLGPKRAILSLIIIWIALSIPGQPKVQLIPVLLWGHL